MNAALASRYTVERQLGAGGMAIVYLGRDARHDRAVAVKVLRPEIAAAVGRDRFLHEISVTAQLNHPHIFPLLDSGDAGGFLYYVMPVAEGESLREKLRREGRLSVEEAVQLTRDVAAALHYAHGRGVVHRDLKPENVMIHQGVPMLMDFGIAVTQTIGTRLTETGLLVGTPAYMSPEQAAGQLEIDGRSDVYALGCVLFELLTGTAPFSATTAQALMAQHAMVTPPSCVTYRPEIPSYVADAVARALAKTPSDRHASAAEFSTALAAHVVDTHAGTKAAIVVLPFANLSADPRDEYISDGLTGEIIAALGRVRSVRVVSRHSTMQLKNTTQDLRTIAHQLNVQYALEGSVRKLESDFRITAHLVDAIAVAEVWSQRYSGSLEKLFEIQEDVSEAIAAALDIELTPS